ncbi:hypothetical protein IW140_001277 [Coemansia sp. RSA 1813]|nr:hypothetical protein EV178_001134 [Coemansia sp. RSA 1646]KAJ1771761.1 hypothetical protein LPJ74_002064 [Coemansia sp. RSA 1843]KAJ2091674.1 hypothetical protein IW138_001656 [Coemansia sp. RSA 986]KAJ2216924.1 hypothetical protein EV179_000959 [Coemansia sp. RSA 487]KAJ2571927.1 hypothetical protein IW140_001277 [Coemansia sp. RSA 1813]
MTITMSTTFNHVLKVVEAVRQHGGFDALCFNQMKLLEAETGRVRGEIPVTKEYLNAIGSTHGGWLSTLVDVGGSLAVASHGFTTTGVSTDLSVSFLAGSKEGDNIIFDAQVLRMGRTLAYTRVDIFNKSKMIATGSHTKYVAREQEVAAKKEK